MRGIADEATAPSGWPPHPSPAVTPVPASRRSRLAFGRMRADGSPASGEAPGSTNLVTVSTAFNPADAQLTRSRLDAAGFHAVVTNELSALSLDGYALAAGGIRVQVPENEAAEAREFLEAGADVAE